MNESVTRDIRSAALPRALVCTGDHRRRDRGFARNTTPGPSAASYDLASTARDDPFGAGEGDGFVAMNAGGAALPARIAASEPARRKIQRKQAGLRGLRCRRTSSSMTEGLGETETPAALCFGTVQNGGGRGPKNSFAALNVTRAFVDQTVRE
jgi:hypothetical protein